MTSVSYHNSGQISSITYANGATTSYGQNSRLWPSSFSASRGATFISSTYGYDGAGNLTSINDSIDNGLDRTLGYDSINRLTSASGPWGSGSFGYDGAGERAVDPDAGHYDHQLQLRRLQPPEQCQRGRAPPRYPRHLRRHHR